MGLLEQLRQQQRPGLQKSYAEVLRPQLGQLASYLLAARAAMLLDAPKRQKLAEERKLDPLVLEGWLMHLQKAAKDVKDPFHAWAILEKNPAELKPLAEAWQRVPPTDALLKDAEIIVDYRNPKPGVWLPDDASFGTQPVRPGEPRFGTDASRPLRSFAENGAAVHDPLAHTLNLTAGTEGDYGSLGSSLRAGHSIRTPTFPLTTSKVFYWVRGTGRVYAAVDSHTVIAGPLHGHLLTSFDTRGQWQWVGLDLSAYKDHRIHLEFTATGTSDFALGMVVQSKGAPASLERPNTLVTALLSAPSPEAMAQAYQQMFTGVLAGLATDKMIGSETAVDQAKLANWSLQHPELVCTDLKPLAKAAEPFLAEQAQLIAQLKTASRLALAIQDGSGENEHVFIRGSHKAPGEMVPRRFLEALSSKQPIQSSGSGRLELAQQITAPKTNPFVTRVLVNRVWHHLFGRGLVASVDNFGKLGEVPTHPELLDYLADHFAQEGWSTKKLIRELMLSNAYRMSSLGEPKADVADPENLLLHKMRLRRLEGEAIRDALLSVSGRLNEKMYGPPVPLFLTSFLDGRGRPASGPLDGEGRRSIYIAVRRNFLSPMMLAFDTPSPFSTVGRRTVSNVPAQALIMMNDPFVHQQAELWAKKIVAQPGTPTQRITAMYETAFARPPQEKELVRALAFLENQTKAKVRKRTTPQPGANWPMSSSI